jgi:hypothetical protein
MLFERSWFPRTTEPVEKVAAELIGGLKLDSRRPKTGLLSPKQRPGRAQMEFFNRLNPSRQLVNRSNTDPPVL